MFQCVIISHTVNHHVRCDLAAEALLPLQTQCIAVTPRKREASEGTRQDRRARAGDGVPTNGKNALSRRRSADEQAPPFKNPSGPRND